MQDGYIIENNNIILRAYQVKQIQKHPQKLDGAHSAHPHTHPPPYDGPYPNYFSCKPITDTNRTLKS